ncbi:MAG: hypothetical protein LC118_14370 [Dehalococcoidia bacterium]|nr:hypothetical protein [Dehalococcoidia bacterium]
MTTPLANSAAALIAHGSDFDRAIAVALAEAGADVAIATESPEQSQEFATASIANEIWAIGREQFSYVLEAASADEVGAYAREVVARLGRCDALIVVEPGPSLHPGEIHRSFASALAEDVALIVVGPPGAPSTTVSAGPGAPAEVVAAVVRELALEK